MKKELLMIAAFLVAISTQAQRYYGIANSNYSGINGLYINPGNIADNRLAADIQLFSFNGAVNQNYGYIESFKNLTNAVKDGTDIKFIKNSNTDNVGANVLGEVRGPSFMFQLGKKQAIGFLSRGRVVGSGRGINSNLFTLINDGIKDVKVANGTSFNSGKVNTTINAFTELGIVYGREIMNTGHNYLKGGITLKRYNGIEFSSIRFKDFNIKILDTATSKVEFNGSIEASKSFNNDNGFDDISSNNVLFGGKGGGFGVDIGAVYEYRDEEPVSTFKYENKYKFKIGFSIQDLGSMKYEASANNENYLINTNGPKVANQVDTANIEFDDVTSYFRTIPGVTATKDNRATKVSAPTTVTLYADYKFTKRVYINALFTGGLVGDNKAGNRTAFQAIVTPRFEGKFLDAGLPISYNALSKDVKVGVGLRLGILFIGSDDILSSAAGIGKLTGSNVYAGIHTGIPYKRGKERKEKEETVPEPTKVVEAPIKEMPLDTDKDGIVDTEDQCPTVFGLAAFKGCPDTDADGIQDSEDKCPTVSGLTAFKGCPDSDADGIQDSEDKCPTVFGLAAFEGCPDTDADGLRDSEDECPTEKGVIALKGCPDTDGDGVADKNDKCVDRPGPMDNAGCPVVTKEILKRLNFAAQAIQFEVNKDVIKKTSYTQLDEVVDILMEYEDYQLLIDGHTDNTGTAEKNQLLSDNRANAVKKYFTDKGIDESRLVATGYGFTKPTLPNINAANKAKNRRVELNMKLKD